MFIDNILHSYKFINTTVPLRMLTIAQVEKQQQFNIVLVNYGKFVKIFVK